jgi:hypothetical protein
MFHQGANIPGTFPRLEGGGDTGRFLKVGDLTDAEAVKPELESIVRAWCDWRDG